LTRKGKRRDVKKNGLPKLQVPPRIRQQQIISQREAERRGRIREANRRRRGAAEKRSTRKVKAKKSTGEKCGKNKLRPRVKVRPMSRGEKNWKGGSVDVKTRQV